MSATASIRKRVKQGLRRFGTAVDRRALYAHLGIKGDKIPADFQGTYPNTALTDLAGNNIGSFLVSIVPKTNDHTAPRIKIKCDCGMTIPLGVASRHLCDVVEP